MLHKTRSTPWTEPSATDEDVAQVVFDEEDDTYSFWTADSKEDLLLAAHYLSSQMREPFQRPLYFVSVSLDQLETFAGSLTQIDEAVSICVGLRGKHYNVVVDKAIAPRIVSEMRGTLIKVPKAILRTSDEILRTAGCRHFGLAPCACEAAS